MRAFAVILAKSEFILASFLKFKTHKAEMANFVTYLFMYCCSVKKFQKLQ